MQAEQRRHAILCALKEARKPVSATALANRFSVSRQVIVGDIALLRAAGEEISATPRGYIIQQPPAGIIHKIPCCHDALAMEAELNTMVDNGCTVVDVVVEHSVYGQLTGLLQLSSRYDVQQFVQRKQASDARLLSALTQGVHFHTLICPSEDAYERVCAALRELKILWEA